MAEQKWTEDAFQTAYMDYMTTSEADARAEANKVNERGIENNCCVAVKFDEHWCLMLGSAALFIAEIGIKPDGVA